MTSLKCLHDLGLLLGIIVTRLENYNKEELVTIMTSLKCSKEYDVPDVGVRGCMCAVRSLKTKVLNNKTNKIMKYSKTYALTP